MKEGERGDPFEWFIPALSAVLNGESHYTGEEKLNPSCPFDTNAHEEIGRIEYRRTRELYCFSQRLMAVSKACVLAPDGECCTKKQVDDSLVLRKQAEIVMCLFRQSRDKELVACRALNGELTTLKGWIVARHK